MASRLELHNLLIDILGTKDEVESRVYFQPPSSLMMKYPCIKYERSNINVLYANNSKYINKKQYQLTIIDADPDSDIPDKIISLPMCEFNRHFVADNINHDVYIIYY